MGEMNITSFSSSLSQTFFWHGDGNVVFSPCFTVFYVFLWNGLINRSSIFIAEELDVCPCWNRKFLHLPWTTKDVWNMLTILSAVSFILVVLFRSRPCDNALETCPQRLFEAVGRSESTIGFLTNVATSSNQATSSRIQHHPTHFTWRCYTPPTPPHPTPPHPTPPHPTPPHPTPPHPTPPSAYKNDLSGIASRLRVPRSSGEPPALSLYIYIYILMMYFATRSISQLVNAVKLLSKIVKVCQLL